MKIAIIILVILFCASQSLYAQRLTLPPYTVSNFNGTTYSVNITHRKWKTINDTLSGTSNQTVAINFADTSIFQNTMDKFLFGYHWGGGTNQLMERRWHINMPMNNYGFGNGAWLDTMYINQEFDSLSLIAESAPPGRKQFVIWKYYHIPSYIYEAPAITWHPSAPYTAINSIFHPIAGDTSGAAFGFAEQHGGRQVRVQGDANFMRYVLVPDSISSSPILCLNKPMLHTKVNKYNGTVSAINDLSSNDAIESRRNGTKWYLSVNLQRLDSTVTLSDTSTVLGIQIRYWYYDKINDAYKSNQRIRFDSTFNFQNSSDTMHHARGVTHRQLAVPTGADTNTFFIRRKDIPLYGSDESLRDICLSAFFRTSSTADTGTKKAPNPHFSTIHSGLGTGDIDSIDIQVTYYGNCPVSISHITLQTPQAREFLWGYHDNTIAIGADRAVKTMQRIQAKYPLKTLRLFRFYTNDEANIMQYQGQRYMNKLLDDRTITEMTNDYYNFIVPQRDYWSGSSFVTANGQFTSAVKKYGADDKNYTLNFIGGWSDSTKTKAKNWDCKNCDHSIEISHNVWQSYPDSCFGFPGFSNAKLPISGLLWNNHFDLCALESTAKEYFLNPAQHYGDKPFIARHTTTVWYDYGIKHDTLNGTLQYFPYINMSNSAPQTGEQLRRAVWQSVLMGAKGVNYADGTSSTHMDSMLVLQQHAIDSNKTFDIPFNNFGLLYSYFTDGLKFLHHVTGDTIGTETVISPTYGHDYFTPTPYSNTHTWTINQHNATNLGVDSTKIYIGLRSLRREKMLLNDKILTIENDLMNLEIMAWEGKGFNWFRTCRNNDTSLYSRFINLNWNGIKVKDLTDNHTEQWDASATYIDVALHKYKDVSIDSQFVVMVLNRRANNLVQVSNVANIPDTTRYGFFSTFEFDSLVTATPSLMYAQLGSREITVPFTYQHPSGKTKLLHITELGGTLDTILCSGCSLSLLYKPGESRILKVVLTDPKSTVMNSNGSFDYVSQHKHIAMPLLVGIDSLNRKPIYDSTRFVYHVVYHRIDTIMGPLGATYLPKIVYKRSRIIDRCSPYDVADPLIAGANNIWQTTAILSDSLTLLEIDPITGFPKVVREYPCKYPSLVVRFDTLDLKEYVYCVFACQKSDGLNSLIIAESQFKSDSSTPHSLEIMNDDSSNIELYGHPVINASRYRNYIAFSTYGNGIIAGTRTPSFYNRLGYSFENISFYHSRYEYQPNHKADARHPSVNTYSSFENDDECALVWQEMNVDSAYIPNTDTTWRGWHIYYTHLRELSGIYHDVPETDWMYNSGNLYPNNASTIYRVSVNPTQIQGYHYHTLPSVLRLPTQHPYIKRMDKILWQADNSNPCSGYTQPRTGMFMQQVWTERKNNASYDSLFSRYNNTIFSCVTPHGNITGTTAKSTYMGGTDSTLIINFDLFDYRWMGHITMSDLTFTSNLEYIYEAKRSQLSHTPYLHDDWEWKSIRRLYNSPLLAANEPIISSAEYLLKRSNLTEPSHYVLSGYRLANSRFALADIISNSSESSMRAGRRSKQERTSLRDSLASDWFNVYQDKIIKFVISDNDYDVVTMSIENKRTQQRVPINVRALSPQDGRRIKAGRIVLRNGGGDEYRFVLGKANEQAQYFEDVYIGDIPELMGKATTEDDYVVDVSQTLLTKESKQLFVYPNPANKEILIRFEGLLSDIADRNFDYVLEFTDALGKTILKQNIKAKETLTLNIQNYVEGIYYFRVRGSSETISTPLTIVK